MSETRKPEHSEEGPTKKQKEAAKENIEKAQKKWQQMSSKERSRRQPQGQDREEPGGGGQGEYFHVEVRSKNDFERFRTHDVGNTGRTQRVAGQRSNGNWATVKWLIRKEDAHVENGRLVGDTDTVRDVLDDLGATPKHRKEDKFTAAPRPNVPEKEKPTQAQKRARQQNIKKAQRAQEEQQQSSS